MGSRECENTNIYVLVDPRDNQVRYIGKSDDPNRRYKRHLAEGGNTHKHNWIKQLTAAGLAPEMRIIEEVDKSRWEHRETYWIQYFRNAGYKLTNMCSGGNGASGISPSEETRRRISQSLKRSWKENPRHISPEHRKALMTGRKKYSPTEEHRCRISEYMTGRTVSDKTRQRISAALSGRKNQPHSLETRQKISRALSGESNGMAKLTMEKAREIRLYYAQGGISLSQLAGIYRVDPKQIHRIVCNQAWKDPDNVAAGATLIKEISLGGISQLSLPGF